MSFGKRAKTGGHVTVVATLTLEIASAVRPGQAEGDSEVHDAGGGMGR